MNEHVPENPLLVFFDQSLLFLFDHCFVEVAAFRRTTIVSKEREKEGGWVKVFSKRFIESFKCIVIKNFAERNFVLKTERTFKRRSYKFPAGWKLGNHLKPILMEYTSVEMLRDC